MAISLRSDRVAVLCIAIIMGAIVVTVFQPAEIKSLASGPTAKYQPGDTVEIYGSEWVVDEVLDWYVVPTYRLVDERGDEALIRCHLIDGTPGPGTE